MLPTPDHNPTNSWPLDRWLTAAAYRLYCYAVANRTTANGSIRPTAIVAAALCVYIKALRTNGD